MMKLNVVLGAFLVTSLVVADPDYRSNYSNEDFRSDLSRLKSSTEIFGKDDDSIVKSIESLEKQRAELFKDNEDAKRNAAKSKKLSTFRAIGAALEAGKNQRIEDAIRDTEALLDQVDAARASIPQTPMTINTANITRSCNHGNLTQIFGQMEQVSQQLSGDTVNQIAAQFEDLAGNQTDDFKKAKRKQLAKTIEALKKAFASEKRGKSFKEDEPGISPEERRERVAAKERWLDEQLDSAPGQLISLVQKTGEDLIDRGATEREVRKLGLESQTFLQNVINPMTTQIRFAVAQMAENCRTHEKDLGIGGAINGLGDKVADKYARAIGIQRASAAQSQFDNTDLAEGVRVAQSKVDNLGVRCPDMTQIQAQVDQEILNLNTQVATVGAGFTEADQLMQAVVQTIQTAAQVKQNLGFALNPVIDACKFISEAKDKMNSYIKSAAGAAQALANNPAGPGRPGFAGRPQPVSTGFPAHGIR